MVGGTLVVGVAVVGGFGNMGMWNIGGWSGFSIGEAPA